MVLPPYLRRQTTCRSLVANQRTVPFTAAVSATFGVGRAGDPVGQAGRACRVTGAIGIVAVGKSIAVLIHPVSADRFRNRWRTAIRLAVARVLTPILGAPGFLLIIACYLAVRRARR